MVFRKNAHLCFAQDSNLHQHLITVRLRIKTTWPMETAICHMQEKSVWIL